MRVSGLRIAIVWHDLMMVMLAWSAAYLIRYNFSLGPLEWMFLVKSLPLAIVAQGLVLWWSGLYKSVWRFASVPDLWNIIRAASFGVLAVSLMLFLLNRLEGVPRTSLLLYPIFLTFFLGAPRLVYRIWKDSGLRFEAGFNPKRVLLLGAGRAGEMLARDMLRDGDYLPVGFLDDNDRLLGAKVHGVPILGSTHTLFEVARELAIDMVVIAIPSASNAQMQRLVELCEQANLPFRTLPRLHDLAPIQPGIKALRTVAIEDLLGREPVLLDWSLISNGLVGKSVLVTGAGGSIGAELSRQIARLGPASLILFERGEFNLYSTEMELRRNHPDLILHAYLGDVCDAVAVDHLLKTHRPEIVFHAAAYKHVPMLQQQARVAVHNNVLGTKVLALAADRYDCSTFVMISTDKAVNPANIMGATKRIAEMFCQALDRRSATRYITVRFGNVLGSAGSVVPLFRKQIENGGPVTVTHPEITRYFMTIPEACQLIMQASVMGGGGEIFLLDMGEPVKISYLAEQMIRLSGKVPGKDIEIVYTGLRPGEKLFEELFYAQESLAKTGHEKILLAKSREVDWKELNAVLEVLDKACDTFDNERIKQLLKYLVPELQEPEIANLNNVIELRRINA